MKGGKMAKQMEKLKQMQGQITPELMDKLPKDFM